MMLTDDDDEVFECFLHCNAKVHHTDKESAQEHAKELQEQGYVRAYVYNCDYECSFLDVNGDVLEGAHFHVASSPIPRKQRGWVKDD
jgi:hypothetical protein